MKTKSLSILLLLILTINYSYSQVDSLYLGLTPPGDSAIIFAPDIVSLDNRFEQSITFSPDRQEIAYGITNSNWDYFSVMVTKYENGIWTDPETAGFMGASDDALTPMYSYDNSKVYFTSSRPQYPPVNIWMSSRTDTGWTEPIKMESPISSSSIEFEVSVSENNTLFFTSTRTGTLGGEDIYYSKLENGEYNTAINMGKPVNTGKGENCPFIARDESYLIISSTREDANNPDIYISYKKDDNTWTNPKNMGPKVNTTGYDLYPNVSPDSEYFFFTRRESWHNSSPSKIYWMSSSIIEELKTTNYSPYVKTEISDTTFSLGDTYSYTIPDSMFFDDDGNETLSLSISLMDDSGLPEFLNFNTQTQTLSGDLTEEGTYNIKITATDTAGASVSDVFSLTVKSITSIDDFCSDNISIFPNPATQFIQIKGIDILWNGINYRFADQNGKVIKQGVLNSDKIDVSKLIRGNYLLTLYSDKIISTKSIIIK